MKVILTVDDDKQYRELLQEVLTSAGFLVLTADNGKEALDIVQKEKIDLIFLDLLLPKIDGTSFYYQLKNVLKKKIPIIILTNVENSLGYDGDVIKEVLTKTNVSFDEIVKKVKNII